MCRQEGDRRKAQQIDINGRNVLNGDKGLQESPFVGRLRELWGRFTYKYFNWRKVIVSKTVTMNYQDR